MTKTMSRFLATASIAALAIGTTGAVQAADLFVEPAPFTPPEVTKQRTISGTVGLYGSYSWLEYDSDDDDLDENPWSIGGDAKVDIPFSDAVSLQIDQYGEGMFCNADDCTTSGNYHGGYLAGAHLTFRDVDRYLFGVFGGGGVVGIGADTDDTLFSQWLAGVEGQLYFGDLTLYAQGGYADTGALAGSMSSGPLHDAWFLRGVGRWYVAGGNGKLEGEFGWATGEVSTADDQDVMWWGAEYEHRVASFASDGFVSLFGRYEGYDYDADGGGDTTNHVFKVGLRMDFNNANPLERERYGAAVDLPNMNRIVGHSRTTE